MFSLHDLVSITQGVLYHDCLIPKIHHVHFDSRKMKPDSLFVALTGGSQDGHLYLNEAFAAGAMAAMVSDLSVISQFPQHPFILVQNTENSLQELAKWARHHDSAKVIAITGSNGKTTTKDIVSHLLSSKFETKKTEKNYNNHLGLPLSILSDTSLSSSYNVFELGMNHAGEMDLLGSIAKPDISVITNIGEAHIGLLGSKGNIARAKGELLAHTSVQGFVCIHHETGFTSLFRELYQGEIVTYSLDEHSGASVCAKKMFVEQNGTRFDVYVGTQRILKSCFVPLWGEHNVLNCLPAIYIAWRQGLSSTELYDALSTVSVSDMRYQPLEGRNGSILINDAYNAAPTSMIAAIDTLGGILPNRNKTVVLGDMYELGTESERMHEQIGHHLNTKNYQVITIGSASQAISKLTGGTHFSSIDSAVPYLSDLLRPNSLFLFKASRGMELEKLINQLT